MNKILLAEDEIAMQKIIEAYLKREQFEVKCVDNGEAAIQLLCEEAFDLAILDWMMPYKSGIEVCQMIKQLNIPTKVLMLTARGDAEDEIKGLSKGAQDYLRKPFDPRILILRVKKLLGEEESDYYEGLKFYPKKGIALVGDEIVHLSKIEQELLNYFMQNKGVILSREKLINTVWGLDYEGDERTLDTHIRRLRQKIGESYIKTHRGVGYSMGLKHE